MKNQSAVNAIEALKKQVSLLEQENAQLKAEFSSSLEHLSKEDDNGLAEIAKSIENHLNTITELHNLKKENRRMKAQIHQLRDAIDSPSIADYAWLMKKVLNNNRIQEKYRLESPLNAHIILKCRDRALTPLVKRLHNYPHDFNSMPYSMKLNYTRDAKLGVERCSKIMDILDKKQAPLYKIDELIWELNAIDISLAKTVFRVPESASG